MWQCEISASEDGEYGAYARIFENLVAFMLNDKSSPRTYVELVDENRALFVKLSNTLRAEIVEPRELLFLLHELDSCERLSWVPRVNPIGLYDDFVIELPGKDGKCCDSGCIFCGLRGSIISKNKCPVWLQFKFDHYSNCPMIWLDKHCSWETDHPLLVPAGLKSMWMKYESSRLGNALQVLQLSNIRAMYTEGEWRRVMSQTASERVNGACQDTLRKLYWRLVEMKMERAGNVGLLNLLLYTIEYEGNKIFENDAWVDGNQLSVNEKKRTIFSIQPKLAIRLFVMHGFCVRTPPEDITDCAPRVKLSCLYCSGSFNSKLCDPQLVNTLYSDEEKAAIQKHLKNSSAPALSAYDLVHQPKENVVTIAVNQPETPKKRGEDFLAIWLSTSLDNAHADDCVFKVLKRSFPSDNCPVCLEVDSPRSPVFVCGHELCSNCSVELRLVECPVCRNPTRRNRLTQVCYTIFVSSFDRSIYE